MGVLQTTVRFGAAFGAAGLLCAGCASDHGGLAKLAPRADAGDSGMDAGRSSDAPDARSIPLDEGGLAPPPVNWSLTLLNGVIDQLRVRFCLVPIVDGRERPPNVAPVPADGLAFGESLVLPSLGPGIDPSTGIHPYLVVSGGAATCADLFGVPPPATTDAEPPEASVEGGRGLEASTDGSPPTGGPDAFAEGGLPDAGDAAILPGVAPVSLPVIPAGTLTASSSYLAVATGCTDLPVEQASGGDAGDAGDAGQAPDASLDGARTEHPGDGDGGDEASDANRDDAGDADDGRRDDGGGPRRAACGEPGTPSLVLVGLTPRSYASNIGFQVVHASQATGGVSLALTSGASPTPLASLGTLAPSQIVPPQMVTLVAANSVAGEASANISVQISPAGNSMFASQPVALSNVLKASHLTGADLARTKAFTFVLVGSEPAAERSPRWRPFYLYLVKNAPLQ